MMYKKFKVMVIFVLMLSLVFGSVAFAFQDVSEDSIGEKIMKLKERNIINGLNETEFAPDQKLTYAQAIQLMVKGFDLNIEHMEFVQEPKASDYFVNVADNAWYASAFIAAHYNEIDIPKSVDPGKTVTREEFTHLLSQSLHSQAEFVTILIWMIIEDETEINKEFMNSIQFMLITNIMTLDEDNYFYPHDSLTRSEAAVYLFDSIVFLEEHGLDPGEIFPTEPVDPTVSMTIEEVNPEINKVIIDWGEKPNAGYQLTIDSIQFHHESKEAIIYYNLHEPLPDHMYAEVITYPGAETYISSEYAVSISPWNIRGGIMPALPSHEIPDMPEELIQ